MRRVMFESVGYVRLNCRAVTLPHDGEPVLVQLEALGPRGMVKLSQTPIADGLDREEVRSYV